MAHTGVFATADECKDAMGAHASTAAQAEAFINRGCAISESVINSSTKINWTALYAGLNDAVKKILADASAAYVGMLGIQYDSSGYFSNEEVINFLNLNRDRFTRSVQILKDINNQDFMKGV
jgi:hypothetical protein